LSVPLVVTLPPASTERSSPVIGVKVTVPRLSGELSVVP